MKGYNEGIGVRHGHASVSDTHLNENVNHNGGMRGEARVGEVSTFVRHMNAFF